jgi:sigma-B regulation protein RsbU (phosphoserine phosphatase)
MDIGQLQKEIAALKHQKQIYEAQNRLFETFINRARSSNDPKILNGTMQNALDIAKQFSGAEKGSLFLLDENGVVIDSILTRNETNEEKRSDLIGKALEKGFAGWIKKNLCAGIVTDAETDERWITFPGQPYSVRSALGVPILRNDTLFGVITLMHSLPEQFGRNIVDFIQQVADQMSLVIENAKLYDELEQSKDLLEKAKQSAEKYSSALDDECQKGKKIQNDFLPHYLPDVKNCDIGSYFHSALQLSGDFYDLFELPDSHLGFVVGDVSGKGIGAALFMALTRSLIRIFSGAFTTVKGGDGFGITNDVFSPSAALGAVSLANKYIAREHGEDGMFVTLFFGIVDQLTGKLSFVNAGHEPALVVGKNEIKQSLKATGPALGPIESATYEIETIQLENGDLLFSYTDGVTEARSETRAFYTRARLESLLKFGFQGPATAFLETIKADLFEFTGEASQTDDITMLAIRWHLRY